MADFIPQLFDRTLLRCRRERAAYRFASVDFLKREAALRLQERLEEVTRRFPLVIELGAHTGVFASDRIDRLVRTDLAHGMLMHTGGARLVCDEERLPFSGNCADAILSTLALHWANDLPGVLVQIQRILKPDGLLLAVLPGARTLQELRAVLERAQMELHGGVSPHISPFVEVRDAGNLLVRAGFSLPMADSEALTVSYEHMFALLDDLRHMGEANALTQRARYLRRDVLLRAAALYKECYGDAQGGITATFELVFLTGWKPHASQPLPAQRGSGQHSLIAALETRTAQDKE